MSRLLLVAATTGYQTRVFAEAARRVGVDVVLATDRCHVLEDPWGDQAIPVRFDQPEAAVEAIAAAGPFDGVLAVADRPTRVASLAAEALGLRFHPPSAVEAARNKFLARQRFQAAGLPVPSYFLADSEDSARRAPYPCVLKPLGLAGSRGVIRANDETEFRVAYRRIRTLLASPDIRVQREDLHDSIQVEQFIPGPEWAVEGVMTRGRLQVLAVFDKPDPLDGPFFEETLYVTAPERAGLIELAARGVGALGLSDGPVHVELRGGGVLEAAARPIGGLCAKALRFDGGMGLEELLVRHALGEDVSRMRREPAPSGVMMIPIPREGVFHGVDGVHRAAATPGIEDIVITAKEGQTLVPLPEGASYLGFIFARGHSPERALRAAHRELQFRIAEALPVWTG
ncbi:MAG: ATP-grasp domain-containing protein [Bryobacteraceae bacterium]